MIFCSRWTVPSSGSDGTRTERNILVELHGAHPLDGLVALDPLLLTGLKDFFVFYPKLAPGYVVTRQQRQYCALCRAHDLPVESSHDGIGFRRRAKVGKRQSTENTVIVVVVESIGKRSAQ